jgi:hypothetical protein
MKKCDDCKHSYPASLVVFMRWDIGPLEICSICACKVRNKLYRFPEQTPFPGAIAQRMYEEARRFLAHTDGSGRAGTVEGN